MLQYYNTNNSQVYIIFVKYFILFQSDSEAGTATLSLRNATDTEVDGSSAMEDETIHCYEDSTNQTYRNSNSQFMNNSVSTAERNGIKLCYQYINVQQTILSYNIHLLTITCRSCLAIFSFKCKYEL